MALAAVDEFVERLHVQADTFDRLLMLGLRERGTGIHLERRARNDLNALPDVRGVVRGPGPIDPAGPAEVATTMFDNAVAGAFSDDAGCYLCNYAYYRAIRRLNGKRVGFVHVPPIDVMPLEVQRREILRLLDAIESPSAAAHSLT